MDAKVVATQEAREQMAVANQPGLPDIVIEHHAHIFLGGKNVALYHFGRSHTNGDLVVLFPADRVLSVRRRIGPSRSTVLSGPRSVRQLRLLRVFRL